VCASSSTSAICDRRPMTALRSISSRIWSLYSGHLRGMTSRPRSSPSVFGPPVGLDHADHYFEGGFQPNMRALQHLIGLADARRCADKDFEPADATVLPPGRF
jgi:hypothetical protein